MPHTLLLADDSLTIQRVIELTFADEDVQVVAVSDGDQAIERLESSPPDIVLADIGMPGRNGYDVARYVKQSPRLSHIPVVLLTGAFEPVDEARAAEVGCDGVLAKPFEPQLVIARVKELLTRSRPARPPMDAVSTDQSRPAPAGQVAPAERSGHLPAERPGHLPAEPPGHLPAEPPGHLNEYFDRLDAAFATRTRQPPGAPLSDLPLSQPPTNTSDRGPVEPAPVAVVVRDPVPASTGQLTAVPEPAAEGSAPEASGPESAPPESASRGSAAQSSGRARIASLPSITDAFAALLEAEQTDVTPSSRPEWPAPPAASLDISDDLVERIAHRVLEQLPDRVIRDLVSDIVSEVAERLVREEIERIKSSIK